MYDELNLCFNQFPFNSFRIDSESLRLELAEVVDIGQRHGSRTVGRPNRNPESCYSRFIDILCNEDRFTL